MSDRSLAQRQCWATDRPGGAGLPMSVPIAEAADNIRSWKGSDLTALDIIIGILVTRVVPTRKGLE